jgi:hypothetical protein
MAIWFITHILLKQQSWMGEIVLQGQMRNMCGATLIVILSDTLCLIF